MKRKLAIITTPAYVDGLKFYMLPKDGGQMVEVRYACDEEGVWKWTNDRSDRTDEYRFAYYSLRASEQQLQFEPQNGQVPAHNRWQHVTLA